MGGNHRPVGEESQLDDMRAAIRGDFERLAARRGGQDLLRERPPELESPTEPEPEPELGPEPEAEPQPEQPPAEEPAAQVEDAPHEEAPKRSFWARLLGL